MKNFLTIDLDYFTLTKNYGNAVLLLQKLMKVAPEVIFIDYHDKIVEYDLIPKGTTDVFNIDYHNDITVEHHPDYNDVELDEGTWGNFLPKSVQSFSWLYPNKQKCVIEGMGLCLPSSDVPTDYPVKYNARRGYSNIPSDINRLVVCISPNWADPSPIFEHIDIPHWHKIKVERIK